MTEEPKPTTNEREEEREEPKLQAINPKDDYNSGTFEKAYQAYQILESIKTDPDPELAALQLGKLLTGKEEPVTTTPEQTINMRNSLVMKLTGDISNHANHNLEAMVEETGEGIIPGLLAELPVIEGKVDEVSKLIIDYQKKKKTAKENPSEIFREVLKKVDKRFREILAAYGSAVVKATVNNAKQRIIMPYLTKEKDKETGEEKQEFDKKAALGYIRDTMTHYLEQEDEKERLPGYQVAMGIANLTYQTIQKKQAQAEAQEKAEKARAKETPEREMKKAA